MLIDFLMAKTIKNLIFVTICYGAPKGINWWWEGKYVSSGTQSFCKRTQFFCERTQSFSRERNNFVREHLGPDLLNGKLA